MRTSLALAAALLVSAVAVFALSSSPAEAAPIWKSTLTSSDAGGSSQTVQLTAQQCYCLQPTPDPVCVHFDAFDAGGLAADCTKDLQLDTTSVTTQRAKAYCFDSASSTAVVVRQLDGGAANVQLFQLLVNPVLNHGCTVFPPSP